jgi:hypothetical protein
MMNRNRIFQSGFRGCLLSSAIVVAAIFAMVISTRYQYPGHPFCNGMLGAGYPALFICDDWGGGSPTSSWGKITFIDVPNGGIRPLGFFIDFLFYTLLLWSMLVAGGRLLQKRINQHHLGWAAFFSLSFTVGFICASLMFFSSRLYVGGYHPRATPTPMLPSPTAPGARPAEAPISTPVP